MECGKHLVVYSSWSTRLRTSCDGYSGPKARNNDVVQMCSAVYDQFEPIGAVEIVIACQEEL
ncbi:MAG TPA: hypothetical protein VFB16_13065 [Bauldia sp.]|nr:hypothetical protein [Bauldia sp.]